jgi:alpha-methylacyl-CoA racemase
MGPLHGVRVVEIANIGPVPFTAMVLADMGADVVRVDRARDTAGPVPGPTADAVMNRGRRSVAVDLKHPEGAALVRRLATQADVLVEGFRPGVAERLGIGPGDCRGANSRLVYGRMTGWGRDGPLAERAGHDINYIAVAGALAAMGRAGQPPALPLNVVGDYAGGGLLLAYGIVCALVERATSGEGQVVDAAMLDGAALLMAPFFALHDLGVWSDRRGENLLDSGAPFYDCYQTADGRWLAVGAIEPHFYAALLRGLGLDAAPLPDQHDRSRWPELKQHLSCAIQARTLDEWLATFEGIDACVAPVLGLGEAPDHPHNRARGVFLEVGGLRQPTPAPRFDRTPGAVERPGPQPGEHTDEVLAAWGLDGEEIGRLHAAGVVARSDVAAMTGP